MSVPGSSVNATADFPCLVRVVSKRGTRIDLNVTEPEFERFIAMLTELVAKSEAERLAA